MIPRKMITLSLAFIFLAGCARHGKEPIAQWSFDQQAGDSVLEQVDQIPFSVHSDVHKPEWVEGVKNQALRLDGYSTWVEGKLEENTLDSTFSFSGWFALESYPVDTAAIISWMSDDGRDGWELGVDPYGCPLIILTTQGHQKIFRSDAPLDKYRWQHLTLVVKAGELQLWNNGRKLLDEESSSTFGRLNGQPDLFLGRRWKAEKVIDLFPTTTINGILDEMTLHQEALAPQQIEDAYASQKPQSNPNLNIPDSRFAGDFYRPYYHPIPDAAWTNETHGLVYYNGKYHIFYQHNPNGPFWAHINWGHMSSSNLTKWEDHRPVLWPEPGYDEFGIWSGHVIRNIKDTPIIMYTGGDGDTYSMCLAHPQDEHLREWKKYEANPVVPGVPESFARKDMRDPYLWKEGDTYYMIIGFGLEEGEKRSGSLLFYKSTNLKDWKFIDTFYTGDPEVDDSGVFWEMPVFWKVGEKYVLLVNKVPHQGVPARALYWVGEFRNERFVPDFRKPKPLEVVNGLLSPSLANDEEGRSTAIAIIPDEIRAKANYELGWAHLYSIPRVWKLKEGQIRQYPHPNLTQLRQNPRYYEDLSLGGTDNDEIPRINSRQVEIQASIIRNDAGKVGMYVGKSPDGREYTEIVYDFDEQQFKVDRTHSSMNPNMHDDVKTGRYPLQGRTDTLDLHVFIDGSVVEVFVGDGAAFTTRMFPEEPSASLTEFFAREGKATIRDLKVWSLSSEQD